MIRTRDILSAAVALGLLAASAGAADFDEVRDKLVEAQSKLKGYAAKFKQVNHISKSMTYEGEGAYEWSRPESVIRYRKQVKVKTTHDLEGEKMVVDESRTSLADGKYLYSMNNDTKTVMKQNFDPESFEAQDVSSVLGHLTMRYNEFGVLPDEKVGEHDCHVLEFKDNAISDDEDDGSGMINVTREVWWFAKDFGMPIKIEGYDKGGKVVRSYVTTLIKLNPEFKPEQFEFKAPEGANVVDHTKE